MKLRHLFEAKARKIVAIMPGGFHPFHPGHKSLYDWAVGEFGKDNVYVAATNDTKERPFPFEVKKKLAAMAGVPESKFIQVNTAPFNARAYSDLVDSDTALVFVRSEKERNVTPLPDQMKIDKATKKPGNEPRYYRSYTGKDLNTADEMGYIAYGPTINFDFSGMSIKSASELRAAWPEMSDEDKLKAAKLMYGNGAPVAVKLLDQALGAKEPEMAEDTLLGAKDPIVVVNDEKGRYKERLKLSVAAKKYKFDPKFIRDQFAAQDSVKVGNIILSAPIAGQPMESIEESDLVLNRTALRGYIKDMIIDYIEKENDIDRLSRVLKLLVGKTVKHRGEKFTVTDEDIVEACKYGSYYCSTDNKTKCRQGPKQSRG